MQTVGLFLVSLTAGSAVHAQLAENPFREAIASSGGSPVLGVTGEQLLAQRESSSDPNYPVTAHPYLEEPLEQLVKRIPELKNIRPPHDLQELTAILKKTGSNVDAFLEQIVDLTAKERIIQESVKSKESTSAADLWSTQPGVAKEQVRTNYLILHHADGDKVEIVEYRTDAAGNRMEQVGLNKGFMVTSGFALSCQYFSTRAQRESTFRYLGEQKIGPHNMHVVAFAQKPGQSTIYSTMTMPGPNARSARFLVQGIAWVDESNFQIVQMRTDLLTPIREIALDTLTTEMTFSKVELREVASPLWLPSEVKVHMRFKETDAKDGESYGIEYRNNHHYLDYQRFRVSVKMGTPE